MEFLQNIPDVFVQFIVVLLLSLLIGLEQRSYHTEEVDDKPLFGTDRTFALIGVFGFLLYILDPKYFSLFIAGAVILTALFCVFYYWKIRNFSEFGFTNMLVALVTYCFGPIVVTQPKWLTVLVVVSLLIMVQVKPFFVKLSQKISNYEFLTLAKFLIIAGIILPIVPRAPEIPYIGISAYTFWLTVVVVSSISYSSYLLQKFVFQKSGIIISGVLGGLYSSTATTLILSRKSKELKPGTGNYAASIVLATAMMYVRVLILMFIFNLELGMFLLPYFLALIAVSVLTGLVIHFANRDQSLTGENVSHDKNPLELKIAALFAVLFVLFSFVTRYTVQYYGSEGLGILSFIVGFTDIDPFLLNLFQGKYPLAMDFIARASMHAIISNNILKGILTSAIADRYTKKMALIGLAIVTVVNILLVIIL